jgi:hypothetical protein
MQLVAQPGDVRIRQDDARYGGEEGEAVTVDDGPVGDPDRLKPQAASVGQNLQLGFRTNAEGDPQRLWDHNATDPVDSDTHGETLPIWRVFGHRRDASGNDAQPSP